MKNIYVVLCIILISLGAKAACAFDIRTFSHEPPVAQQGDNLIREFTISIPREGLKRARILVAKEGGYKVVEMTSAGDVLSAVLRFEDLAVIKYQFQLETVEGALTESPFYLIREPSNKDMEGRLKALNEELAKLQAQKQQLENTLHSVETADVKELAQRKHQELAKALLNLGKAERELLDARAAADVAHRKLEQLNGTERGKQSHQARQLLEEWNTSYWGNK